MALLEAMACGLPVLVTQGMTEHITDEENGLVVPPRDPQAIAAALRRLITDASFRERCGARNSRKIHADYTMEAVTEAYLSTYQRIALNGRNHKARR